MQQSTRKERQMVVCHGSNVEVRTPRIIRPNRTLDFGNGFYTMYDDEKSGREIEYPEEAY